MAIAAPWWPWSRRDGRCYRSYRVLSCSLPLGFTSIWLVTSSTQLEYVTICIPDVCLLQRALQAPVEVSTQKHLRSLVFLSLLQWLEVEATCLLQEIVLFEIRFSLFDLCEFVGLAFHFMIHPCHFQFSLFVQLSQMALEAILWQQLEDSLPRWNLHWASVEVSALVAAWHLQLLGSQTLCPNLLCSCGSSGHTEWFTAWGGYAAHELIYLLTVFRVTVHLSCSR